MRITHVEFSGTPKDGFLTYVSVELDGVFVVKNMKIVKRMVDNQLLLLMPTRTKADGTYVDVAHPVTSDFRRALEDRVLSEFRRVKAAA